MRLGIAASVISLAVFFAACGGGGGSSSTPSVNPSGTIVLSPQGSAASPAGEGCSAFDIFASEAGYSGNFTISMGAGTNYSLPSQTTNSGAWVISLGLLCVGGFQASTTQFTVTDSLGHSASTYISTL
jgi:hypothetical protein